MEEGKIQNFYFVISIVYEERKQKGGDNNRRLVGIAIKIFISYLYGGEEKEIRQMIRVE